MSLLNDNKKWFSKSKYGLFIHFGLYSILAGEYKGVKTNHNAEWIMNTLNIPVQEYEDLAKQFDPVNFSADQITADAKRWGMKYLVFTAKHHDGFAMYDSKCSEFSSVKCSPCHRDFVRELKEACDKYGLRFGLYYSQSQDWNDPDGFRYFTDNKEKNFERYLERKCLPQIRELLSQYGRIDLMWFDTPMGITHEQSSRIAEMVRSLQPDCVINGRLGNGLGDYVNTADDMIPRLPYEEMWEVPSTLNNTWGYNKYSNRWKNPLNIIKLFVKINARGGNYLANIGPDAWGNVPEESRRILETVGNYVNENKEAFWGTQRVPQYFYEPQWGDLTCKEHRLYVHIFEPRKAVELLNMKARIKRAYVLKSGLPCEYASIVSCSDNWVLRIVLPEEMYQEAFYCVCLELEEEYPLMEKMKY